ncbi:hypothetical protein THRCLA_09266 [Thraustotheca clavata]|uniref:PHD-type domain-containing protein n=1 Tax=Thraustotheca clavata TaxID=74557 RepID=A0A1V9YXQ2_9STRA|nr:hypothetical protein THRCLA_09266 [Thraustotheca clavata]
MRTGVVFDGVLAPRRDQIEPCQRCHSDVNAKLLVHCTNCALHRHTYCFHPPLIANPSYHNPQWVCANCEQQNPSPSKHSTKPVLSTLEYAKQRALALPIEPKPHRKRLTQPIQLPKKSQPRPHDWREFCEQKAHKIPPQHISTTKTKPLRGHRRRLHSLLEKKFLWWRCVKPREPPTSLMVELTEEERANLEDWQLKYVDAPENDDIYLPISVEKGVDFDKSLECGEVQEVLVEQVREPIEPLNPVAIILIQNQHRVVVANAEADKRRKQQRHIELIRASRESRMARRIQRWFRRYLTKQSSNCQCHQAATVLSQFFRRYLDKLHHHRSKQAVAERLLQSQRAKDAKLELLRVKRREKATKTISLFILKVVLPYINLRQSSSIRLQATWRMYHCRKKYKRNPRILNAIKIQSKWRQFCAKKKVYQMRLARAKAILTRFIQRWHVRRLLRTEKKRLAILTAAKALGVIEFDPATATLPEIFSMLGTYYYGRAEFWSAAACFERACRNGWVKESKLTFAMAYSHHQTWHRSYDIHNLTSAYNLYKEGLATNLAEKDPYILFDFAIVLAERGEYPTALDLFNHIISLYPTFEHIRNALLWTGVVLLHAHRGNDSLRCFSLLMDNPPPQYTPLDMTILCALSYNSVGNSTDCKQGLGTALGMYKAIERKKASTTDMLLVFAKKALQCTHYLLAYELYFYALRRSKHPKSESWYQFSDVLRHLGQVDECKQALDASLTLDSSNSMAITTLSQWPLPTNAFSIKFTTISDLIAIENLKA